MNIHCHRELPATERVTGISKCPLEKSAVSYNSKYVKAPLSGLRYPSRRNDTKLTESNGISHIVISIARVLLLP